MGNTGVGAPTQCNLIVLYVVHHDLFACDVVATLDAIGRSTAV